MSEGKGAISSVVVSSRRGRAAARATSSTAILRATTRGSDDRKRTRPSKRTASLDKVPGSCTESRLPAGSVSGFCIELRLPAEEVDLDAPHDGGEHDADDHHGEDRNHHFRRIGACLRLDDELA